MIIYPVRRVRVPFSFVLFAHFALTSFALSLLGPAIALALVQYGRAVRLFISAATDSDWTVVL